MYVPFGHVVQLDTMDAEEKDRELSMYIIYTQLYRTGKTKIPVDKFVDMYIDCLDRISEIDRRVHHDSYRIFFNTDTQSFKITTK